MNEPIWDQLVGKIQQILQSHVNIIFPNEITEKYLGWFQQIERQTFREDLRYSPTELTERWNQPELLFFFILSNQIPIAVLLGYKSSIRTQDYFYLDTIATIIERRGIGGLMIASLIKWAKKRKFSGIRLDTEVIDERGRPLTRFYERFGFQKIKIDKKTGNITLEYPFS